MHREVLGEEASDSGSSESDEDLLPDVYTRFEPQPHDNDSSDYNVDEEENVEIASKSSSSSKDKKKRVRSKKSVKSAHPKIEHQER